MRAVLFFTLLALAYAQETAVTEEKAVVPEIAVEQAAAVENEAPIAEEATKREEDTVVAIAEPEVQADTAPIAAAAATNPITAKAFNPIQYNAVPYPLFRQALPFQQAPYPAQFRQQAPVFQYVPVFAPQQQFQAQAPLAREAINQDNLLRQLPTFIQYVPVFVQPQQQQATEAAADASTSRQLHAGAGFNLGPFGGAGINAGLGPDGLGLGFGVGFGQQYSTYGAASAGIQPYVSSYPTTTYTTYSAPYTPVYSSPYYIY